MATSMLAIVSADDDRGGRAVLSRTGLGNARDGGDSGGETLTISVEFSKIKSTCYSYRVKASTIFTCQGFSVHSAIGRGVDRLSLAIYREDDVRRGTWLSSLRFRWCP